MPRDAAGISRVGMFEKVTTPDGTVFTPRSGSGGSTTYDVTGKLLKTSNVRMPEDALTYALSMQNDYALAPIASEETLTNARTLSKSTPTRVAAALVAPSLYRTPTATKAPRGRGR